MATDDGRRELQALGPARLRILSCLGGDMPSLPQHLSLRAGEDPWLAFSAFVAGMVRACAAETDPLTRGLIGAAQLLIGELSGADVIVDTLPAEAPRRDHGAGYCLVAASETLRAVLPLPETLQAAYPWLAGSSAQATLRAWLNQQRNQLVWREREGDYVLGAGPG